MTRANTRVLMVLGSLARGGAETWAVQVIQHLDLERIAIDILVHMGGGAYEGTVRSLGCQIIQCPPPRSFREYSSALYGVLTANGPYAVVHSNLLFFDGVVMRTAHRAGVPVRIAHARNTSDGGPRWGRRAAYRALMRHWIKVHSTHVLAVSNLAASAVLGRGALLRGGYTRLTGIDLSSFQAAIDRGAVRDKLGIEPQALAVGHIGSFRTQKNHRFIVQVADELRRVDTRARIVLIGEGPLKDAIASEVRSRGLSGMFRFAGEWPEISKALRAMDAFVFPSLYEGLPRALLEAQAAGLPCIASDRITDEVSAWPGRVTFLPIGAGAAAWAHSLVKALSSERDPMLGPRTIQALDELGFSIGANAATLETLYLKDKLVV